MNKLHKEQYPLLWDGYSDEELRPCHRYHKRHSSIGYRGRAKNTVKGAAAILTKWPDFWTSSLIYWWLGFGMFALTIFIVYNTVAVFSILPSVHTKVTEPRILQDGVGIVHETFPGVFMHQIYEENEKVNLNKYKPYLEELTKRYAHFNYNFLLIVNDTSSVTSEITNEDSNRLALDSLLTEKNLQLDTIKNVKMKHTTVTTFMDNSPLKNYWKDIPKQYISFIIKAISVWENRGIALDPLIFIPHSPYFGNKQKVFDMFAKFEKPVLVESNSKTPLSAVNKYFGKKVNNIRDIIDALENEHEINDLEQESLTAAENTVYSSRTPKLKKIITHKKYNETTNTNKNENSGTVMESEDAYEQQGKILHENVLPDVKVAVRRRRNVGSNKHIDSFILTNKSDSKPKVNPMITVVNNVNLNNSDGYDNSTMNPKFDNSDSKKLTIDLKGSIIATQTPCHAFINTVFSNVVEHTEKSVTDFIIAELSLFCKGNLSTCKGIDVILN